MKFRYWTVRFWLENAVRDLGARLAGHCNRAPLCTEGGYHFWRCELQRGHEGPHRSGNYLWGPGGSLYAPVQGARAAADRKPVMTRRQRRYREEWEAMCHAKRAHEAGIGT